MSLSKRATVSILLLSLVFFSIKTDFSLAQVSTIGGIGLGFFLNQALNKVNKAIEGARNAARSTIIDAGQQASWSIAGAREAYKDSLNITIDKTDKEIQDTVARIQTMVEKIETGTDADLQEAIGKSVQIVNSLPLSKSFPQLTTQSPKLVAPSLKASTKIVLNGNFVDSARPGYRPYLTIAGKQIQPLGLSTQQLVFEVDNALLGAPAEASVKVASINLTVPYRENYWVVFHQENDAEFVLPIGLLPIKPGKIKVVSTIDEASTEVLDFSQDFTAANYEGTNTFCANADTPNGWHVVTNGNYPQPEIRDEYGNRKFHDWNNAFHDASPNNVCWDFSLDDDDNQVDFTINYTASRENHDLHDVERDVDLSWNASALIPLPNTGKWKVAFTPFDGETQEFSAPGVSVPAYCTIGVEGTNVSIRVASPPELN